jgi:hypothetical protein
VTFALWIYLFFANRTVPGALPWCFDQQGKERTRAEINKDLNLKYTDEELEIKLEALISGDLISHGQSHYDYKITKDKTYELLFRNIYQKEIDNFVPDIKKELRKIMGKDNYTKGKFQEYLIKERLKKPFKLKDMTENGEDATIIPTKLEERIFIKRGLKTYEIDLIITGKMNNRTLKTYIDIKNTQKKYGKREYDRWAKITEEIKKEEPGTLFMTYSENGYTKGTKEKLKEKGVLIIKQDHKG